MTPIKQVLYDHMMWWCLGNALSLRSYSTIYISLWYFVSLLIILRFHALQSVDMNMYVVPWCVSYAKLCLLSQVVSSIYNIMHYELHPLVYFITHFTWSKNSHLASCPVTPTMHCSVNKYQRVMFSQGHPEWEDPALGLSRPPNEAVF